MYRVVLVMTLAAVDAGLIGLALRSLQHHQVIGTGAILLGLAAVLCHLLIFLR
jgi:hypothetical protein